MIHNPEFVDISQIPKGWRLAHLEEFPLAEGTARIWLPYEEKFSDNMDWFGEDKRCTYIVEE